MKYLLWGPALSWVKLEMWVLTPQTKASGLPLLETHQLNCNGCYVYKQWGSVSRGHVPECNSYWNKSYNLNNAQTINNNQRVWSVGFIGQDKDRIHHPFVNFQKVVVIEKWPQGVFNNSMSPKWSSHSGKVTQKTQESEIILGFQDRPCLKEKQASKNPYPALLCSGLKSREQLSPDSWS